MITRATLTAGGRVIQHRVAPTVYLDHWALRTISADKALAPRFSAALERRRGTLALSWVNIAEFGRVLDEEQVRQAEAFIGANLPRVFCIEVNPFEVIDRERAGSPSPEADDALLTVLAGVRADPPREFTARGLFAQVRGRSDATQLATIFVDRYETLRAEYNDDEAFRRLVQRTPRSAGTLTLLREILATFMVDRRWTPEPNDAVDFFHAVVPTRYCDLVLLDKDWAAHVERPRKRLRDAGVDQAMATVLSKQTGIERLMAALEDA